MKNKLARSYIYSKTYPRNKRMGKKEIRQTFWDFYALELLRAKVTDPLRFQRVENILRETATKLLSEQVKALEASIRGEVRYFVKACRSRNGRIEACYVPKFLMSVYKKHTPFSLDLNTIKDIFEKAIWGSEFGGWSWANATKILIEAKKYLKDDNLSQMIFYIDHIFDIHHNNGFILNKTNFNTLDNHDLNSRSEIKSLKDILRHMRQFNISISPIVKRELEAA